ncbi:MAG: hypothetical protein H0Z28_09125 [Archaeoglobus sp.]|nr:hypothetical protein [Archaeoglobus sp.]
MQLGLRGYALFAILGMVSALLGIFVLPAFIRLEGPLYVHAIFLLGMVFAALAFWQLSRSPSAILKGLVIYATFFLLWYLEISAYLQLTLIFLISLIVVLVLSGIKKTENFRIAGFVAVAILVSYLVFMAFLGFAAYQHYNARYIHVEKLELPSYYADLSESDFPFIQNVSDRARIDIAPAEMAKFERIALQYTKPGDTFFFAKFGEDYYKIIPLTLIEVELAEPEPDYTKISEKELECCPTLVELMNKAKEVGERKDSRHFSKVSLKELGEVRKLIEEKGHNLEYKGGYYNVFLCCSVWIEKVVIPKCEEVSQKELEIYPALKKALVAADKEGRAIIKVSPEEWSGIQNFIQEKDASALIGVASPCILCWHETELNPSL